MSPAGIKTCRDFFRNDQGFLCYQYEGDALLRICVLKVSRDAVLHAAHGGALVGHPGIMRTAANVAQFLVPFASTALSSASGSLLSNIQT